MRMERIGLYDAADPDREETWFPSSPESAELIACAEACRNLQRLLGGVGPVDARGLMLVVPPTFELLRHALKLHGLVGRAPRTEWPPPDLARFRDLSRKLRKHEQALHAIRNKRAAHHDTEYFGSRRKIDAPSAGLLLPAIRDALVLLVLALNHTDVFQWSRFPSRERPDEVEICRDHFVTTARIDPASNEIREIVKVTLSVDPRHEVCHEFMATLRACETFAARAAR